MISTQQDNHHLTPEEWNQVMKEESDYVLVDTRNWYEYEMSGSVELLDAYVSDIERQVAASEDLSFVSVLLLTAGLYAVNLLVNVVAVLVSVTTISGEISTSIGDPTTVV